MRRIGIATKIFVGFSGLLIGVVLLAMLSVREIRSAADDLRVLRDGHLALARIAAQLETHQQNRLRDLRRALEERDASNRELILRIVVTYYPSVIRAGLDSLGRACERLEALAEGASPRARHARQFCVGLAHRTYAAELASSSLEGLARDLASASATAMPLDALAATVATQGEDLRSAMFELDRYLQGATDAAVTRAESHERSALFRVLASTLGALLLGLVVTVMASRALAPIQPLVRYARALARGDYHQPLNVAPRGELADLADELRRMARARDDREEKLDRQAKELEKAYLRVAELKRYHESIVRSLRTGIVVTDRVGIITSANRAARTHWSLDDLIGQPLGRQPLGTALEDQLGPFEALLGASAPKTAPAVELGTHLADLTAVPLESERGEILGLVIALEDVTEAVRTKEALLRSERLAAIGRMSAHVTHELRNPLASISLNAELLEELSSGAVPPTADRSDEETRTLCRAIGREADRLNALAEEYLRFARLPRPELVSTAPERLLRPLAAFVERDCRAASVTLELSLPDALPPIAVDPDQLRQALLNLLRNGKESMPEGGTLTLGARSEAGFVELFVRDEGQGIDPATVDRIFDPFYSTKLTGTGLGLALTQQIVQEHGAHLEVTSTVGAGTEFVLRFGARAPTAATPRKIPS